jgi:segregation and condensation protein B
MPTSPVPDETPAWIKGDLPSEMTDPAAEPDCNHATVENGAPGRAAEPDEPSLQAAPAQASPLDVAEPEASNVAGAPAEPEAASEAILEMEPELAARAQTLPSPEVFQEPANGAETSPLKVGGDYLAAAAGADRAANGERVLVTETAPTAEPPSAEPLNLAALVESLLFVADGAVPIGRLAEALEVPAREVEAALAALGQGYRERGLSLQRFRDKVQLTTSPLAASRVERFLGLAAATPLSRAALETLAIVAYQQPVTRPQIEAVRGVNSDSVIKNLLNKGLIEDSGRAEGPGRPVLYSTTPEFMQHFGLASLSDLPPLSLPSPEGALHPERILQG